MDYDVEQTTITFATTDTPSEVTQFYVRELESRGWGWLKECEFFVHAGGRGREGYTARLNVEIRECFTFVTISYKQVLLSCDVI